jgi:hypothetical protein
MLDTATQDYNRKWPRKKLIFSNAYSTVLPLMGAVFDDAYNHKEPSCSQEPIEAGLLLLG